MSNKDEIRMPSINEVYTSAQKTKAINLTKQEYFAGLAMQAMADARNNSDGIKNICQLAVKYADALLEALEKKDET